MVKEMNYKEYLKCQRAKCLGLLTVHIKLVVKGNKLVDVARCPECRRLYTTEISWVAGACAGASWADSTCATTSEKIKFDQAKRSQTSGRCPHCGKSTHFTLPLSTMNIWIKNIAQNFFRCTHCGSPSKIRNTERRNGDIRVTLYCEQDWLEFQKKVSSTLFQIMMTQIQKVA